MLSFFRTASEWLNCPKKRTKKFFTAVSLILHRFHQLLRGTVIFNLYGRKMGTIRHPVLQACPCQSASARGSTNESPHQMLSRWPTSWQLRPVAQADELERVSAVGVKTPFAIESLFFSLVLLTSLCYSTTVWLRSSRTEIVALASSHRKLVINMGRRTLGWDTDRWCRQGSLRKTSEC